MRQLYEVWKEFLELMIEQQALALSVAQKWQLFQSWNHSMEHSQHNRDLHNRYWDSDYALGCQKKYESEWSKAREQFETNQKRLKDPKDEIIAIMTATGAVPVAP